MDELFGIGNIKSETRPVNCKITGTTDVATTGALCDRTDCPSYGKWWCPFTGW
nr:hypothetical protein [uncultured Methanobacterium sp.]